MAHSAQINVNGVLTAVTEFDNSAQAIDDTVTVLGAPTTPQAALSALGAGVRPRLGINMDFRFNQRNQDLYTASGKTYTVDGWYLSNTGGTVTVNSDGTITLGTTNNNFWQLIPPDEFMMGVPFTFSALTPDGKLYTMTVDELSTSTNQSQTTDFGLIRVQYYNGNVGVNINPTQKGVTLLCAKPESGPNQTLAYQDSTGAWHRLPQPEDGGYMGQLAKCEYYHKRFAGNLCMVGFGFATSSNFITCLVSLPHGLRISNPTVTLSGTIYAVSSLGYGASSIAITSQPQGAVIAQSGNLLGFTLSTSGLEIATGNSVILQIRDTTSYFDIAADL